jgi:C1A family cysteine protease
MVLYQCQVRLIVVDNLMEGDIISFLSQRFICFFVSHALLAVGYSDQSESFVVRNSWGQNWVRLFLFVLC